MATIFNHQNSSSEPRHILDSQAEPFDPVVVGSPQKNLRLFRPDLFGQTCALPPSTKSSTPVMKLESSDARNNAAFATSSGSPRRPIGMVEAIRPSTSADCRFNSGVLIGPGLTTFERI